MERLLMIQGPSTVFVRYAKHRYFGNGTVNLWLNIIPGKCFEICNC